MNDQSFILNYPAHMAYSRKWKKYKRVFILSRLRIGLKVQHTCCSYFLRFATVSSVGGGNFFFPGTELDVGALSLNIFDLSRRKKCNSRQQVFTSTNSKPVLTGIDLNHMNNKHCYGYFVISRLLITYIQPFYLIYKKKTHYYFIYRRRMEFQFTKSITTF